VLVTVAALYELRGIIIPKQLYGACLMSPSLLRKYLARLVKAGLVGRYTHRGRARLRLTLPGLGVVALYQRHLLGGARQYERKQSIE
jgi:DNA-binding MarR family transcriptional regulator